MRKNIDIDHTTLTKLKLLSVFEDVSVKSLMEKAVSFYISHKEKEDLGLLLLMQQVDTTDTVSEEDFFKALNDIN